MKKNYRKTTFSICQSLRYATSEKVHEDVTTTPVSLKDQTD